MAVYNGERFLKQAIESVLESSFSGFELIIVDDCSTDQSLEISREYEQKDARVHVYKNETNLGDYPNRNKAASLAKGKYLKYVDMDDLIYPSGLELLVNTMEMFPDAGYGLCSLEQDKERIFPFQLSPEEAYHRHYLESPLFHKAPLSAIIRASAFREVGGFTGRRYVGDFEMWHFLSRCFPVVLMQHGVVWYRVHEAQESTNVDAVANFRYTQLSLEFLGAEGCPLKEDDKVLALRKIKRGASRYILRAAKDHGWHKARELMRMANLSYVETVRNAFRKQL
jgi:glycosyltransferase involved in cell wall biosynthesis